MPKNLNNTSVPTTDVPDSAGNVSRAIEIVKSADKKQLEKILKILFS